ncbi:MAG: redoxin domain-containing protein [Dehalococcoidia bacterium]
MVEIVRKVKVGDVAADFTLPDHNGNGFALSALKGKRVLLSFHPLAWTAVCASQMLSLEKNYEVFESLNAAPVGLSVDPVPSKKAWADSLGIKKAPLLSDFWPHGGVAKLFDIFREKNGFSERANILVDEKGVIALFKTYPLSQLPDIDEIIAFIRRMP